MQGARSAVLTWISFACIAGGCKRGLLVSGPDAASPDGGIVVGDGGGAVDTGIVSSDASIVFIGDASAADAPATDALRLLPPEPLRRCPSVPSVPSCPADRPVLLSACPLAGLTCEYGGRDINCRGRWVCAADLTWQVAQAECAGALANRCPDQMPEGGSPCAADVFCSYPGQTTCSCSGNDGRWSCISGGGFRAGCPDQLPFFGQPCDPKQTTCHYGDSCFEYVAICCSGSWVPQLGSPCSE
jgi:hypothetical protein